MKSTLPAILLFLVPPFDLGAQEPPGPSRVYTEPFVLPKGDLLTLLEIMARIMKKPIVVANERMLDLEIPLLLPAPVTEDVVRKTIASLLLLEGYEVAEVGGELRLKRILTDEQCDALNKALGRKRGALPRGAVIRHQTNPDGSSVPYELDKTRIIIRPEAGE